MAYVYPADQNGFPFPYRLTVRYTLSSDGLTVSTTAENTGTAPMPLADGWHPYFTLGGTADDWTLQINGGTQFEFDADLLPTGARLSDNRFAEAASLRGIGLDNSFELNGRRKLSPAANLHPARTHLHRVGKPQRRARLLQQRHWLDHSAAGRGKAFYRPLSFGCFIINSAER